MYRFFYVVLLKHFTDEEIALNYTDLDSLLLSIVTERDVFEVLRQPTIAQYLDQSVYAEGHPLKDDTNKGKICTFKIGPADSGVRGLKVQDVCVLLLLSSQGEEQQSLRPTVAYHKP